MLRNLNIFCKLFIYCKTIFITYTWKNPWKKWDPAIFQKDVNLQVEVNKKFTKILMRTSRLIQIEKILEEMKLCRNLMGKKKKYS